MTTFAVCSGFVLRSVSAQTAAIEPVSGAAAQTYRCGITKKKKNNGSNSGKTARFTGSQNTTTRSRQQHKDPRPQKRSGRQRPDPSAGLGINVSNFET